MAVLNPLSILEMFQSTIQRSIKDFISNIIIQYQPFRCDFKFCYRPTVQKFFQNSVLNFQCFLNKYFNFKINNDFQVFNPWENHSNVKGFSEFRIHLSVG